MHFKPFIPLNLLHPQSLPFPPSFNQPRRTSVSQLPWLPGLLGTKITAMAATANISFLCDLRKGASVREQNSKQPDWRDKGGTAPAVANSKPMALMGCAPPHMWGVVLAPDRMSAENKWNGQVGEPAGPAQTSTCRR